MSFLTGSLLSTTSLSLPPLSLSSTHVATLSCFPGGRVVIGGKKLSSIQSLIPSRLPNIWIAEDRQQLSCCPVLSVICSPSCSSGRDGRGSGEELVHRKSRKKTPATTASLCALCALESRVTLPVHPCCHRLHNLRMVGGISISVTTYRMLRSEGDCLFCDSVSIPLSQGEAER